MSRAERDDRAPDVLVALESLISPGRRSRLSPYVEAAQLSALFGEAPDPERHPQDVRRIVAANTSRLSELAEAWAGFARSGKDFVAQDYSERDFLDAYLAYYLSFNVPKVQLVLLDLVRQGKLAGDLTVVDLGVGTGTTALAVIDFLVSWSLACELVGTRCPVNSVQLSGYDVSPAALQRSSDAVTAYAEALETRIGKSGPGNEAGPLRSSAILGRAASWARSSQWHECDLNESCPPPAEGVSLIVASNSLSECDEGARLRVRSLIEASQPGSLALLVENGSEWTSRWLMSLRRSWTDGSARLAAIAPCGGGLEGDAGKKCHACWMSRREAFHETALVNCFRACWGESAADRRSWDAFENRLLSWSYAVLEVDGGRDARQGGCGVEPAISPTRDGGSLPDLTYLGSFWMRAGALQPADSGPDEDVARHDQYLKVCPAALDADSALVHRRPGIAMPALRFGERFSLQGVRSIDPIGDTTVIELLGGDETRFERTGEYASGFLPADAEVSSAALDDLGYRLFGFARLSGFQHRVVERALKGRSTLCIAATGAGKSECFIMPAMLLDGVTVVISPLKSLMADQYEKRLSERFGLQHLSTFVNGDVSLAEREARLRRLEDGYYKLIYLTPEQLQRGYVLDALRRANRTVGIRYLALDEAHCISQWGHQFRPAYLNIWRRLRDCGIDPVRIALTATASPTVREDLCEELGLDPEPAEDGGDVIVESADRPELNLIVRVTKSTGEKAAQVVSELRAMRVRSREEGETGAALVFMPWTGQNPEHARPDPLAPGVSQFAAYIEQELGTRVAIYHGKMDADEGDKRASSSPPKPLGDLSGRTREGEQARFMNGECDVMVATKGFGMGIDKPNIRLVVHRSAPSNLEAYAQEAGRAGRDHKVADALLLYSADAPGVFRGQPTSDLGIQTSFVTSEYVRREDVEMMHALLGSLAKPNQRRLYFTSDEALDFFEAAASRPRRASDEALDLFEAAGSGPRRASSEALDFFAAAASRRRLPGLSASFRWPDFPPRLVYDTEFAEHREVLDRGHDYDEKSAYVDRILQALYKFQPPGEKGPERGYVEAVAATPIEIRDAEVRQVEQILGSTHYYGRLFREAGVDEAKLVQLLTAETVAPLADALDLSLREAAAVCRDIAWTDRGQLYRCRLRVPLHGPASGIKTAREWLHYAGATRRATRSQLERRILEGRREKPVLTDWFGEGQITARRGWEVELGEAFRDVRRAEEHLDEFMAVHDRRRELEWRNFTRLLTEYIGVEEDGSSDGWVRPRNCLKAVLLGYLKTYDTIEGDNCLSCSRCVPDEKFDASLDERKAVVVRLGASVIDLLERIEETADAVPSERRMTRLMKALASESAAGRSAHGYVTGWAMRVLTDHPGHRGAMWVEMQAMLGGAIELQPERLANHIGDITRVSNDKAELTRLKQAVADVHDRHECRDSASVPFAQAALFHELHLAAEERAALERVVARSGGSGQSSDGRRRLEQAVDRLFQLVEPSAGPADAALFADLIGHKTALGGTVENLTPLWAALLAATGADAALDYLVGGLRKESRAAVLIAIAQSEEDVSDLLALCLEAAGSGVADVMPTESRRLVVDRLLTADRIDPDLVMSLLRAEAAARRQATTVALLAHLLGRAEDLSQPLGDELASFALGDPSTAREALATCRERQATAAWLAARAVAAPLEAARAQALTSLLTPADRTALSVCGAQLLGAWAEAVSAGDASPPGASLLDVLWAAAELLGETPEGRGLVLECWPLVSRGDSAYLAKMGAEYFEDMRAEARDALLNRSLNESEVANALYAAGPRQAARLAALAAWAEERLADLDGSQLAGLVGVVALEGFSPSHVGLILRRCLTSPDLAAVVFVDGSERPSRVMMMATMVAQDSSELDMQGVEAALRILRDDEQALQMCGRSLLAAATRPAMRSKEPLDDHALDQLWPVLELAWGDAESRRELHATWLSLVSQLPDRLGKYCAWCLGCRPAEPDFADEALGFLLVVARPRQIEYFFRVEPGGQERAQGPRITASALAWARFRAWLVNDLMEVDGRRRLTASSFERLRKRFEPLTEGVSLPVCTACLEHLMSAVATKELRVGVAAELHKCYVLAGRDGEAKTLAGRYPSVLAGHKAGAQITVKGGRSGDDLPWLQNDIALLLDILLKRSRR